MDILGWLNYLGITPDKLLPLAILAFLGVLFLNNKLNPLNKAVRRISNAIIEIQTIFKTVGIPLTHLLTEAPGSPLRPTDWGVKLIQESGLEKILNENKERFVNELKNSLPKDFTEYDVQETARNVLISLKNDPIINPIKEYAYKNALDIDIILSTGGLWLRDDFLGQPRKISKGVE